MKRPFKTPAFHILLEEDTDLEFQITPMIDLLLVLLIFFMAITTTKILRNDLTLQLPTLSTETFKNDQKTDAGQGVINISWQNSWSKPLFTMEQKEFSSEEIVRQLIQKQNDFQKVHPQKKFRVLIRADRHLPYHFLQNLLKLCQKKGLTQITFATHPL